MKARGMFGIYILLCPDFFARLAIWELLLLFFFLVWEPKFTWPRKLFLSSWEVGSFRLWSYNCIQRTSLPYFDDLPLCLLSSTARKTILLYLMKYWLSYISYVLCCSGSRNLQNILYCVWLFVKRFWWIFFLFVIASLGCVTTASICT